MFDLVSSSPLIQTMDRSMSLATKRMGLIAGNMANLDTPGYRTRDFDFQTALKQELAQLDGHQMPVSQTHPMHFQIQMSPSLPPMSASLRPAYERNDGNDVSLDRETAALARTQTAYQLSSSFAQQELKKIYQIIRDGKA